MPANKAAPPGTLAYLRESGRPVYIRCKKCGHSKLIECDALAQHFGWASETRVIAERLRCVRCKSKQAEFTTDNLRAVRTTCPQCGKPR
jgi:ribosomal protein S27E